MEIGAITTTRVRDQVMEGTEIRKASKGTAEVDILSSNKEDTGAMVAPHPLSKGTDTPTSGTDGSNSNSLPSREVAAVKVRLEIRSDVEADGLIVGMLGGLGGLLGGKMGGNSGGYGGGYGQAPVVYQQAAPKKSGGMGMGTMLAAGTCVPRYHITLTDAANYRWRWLAWRSVDRQCLGR